MDRDERAQNQVLRTAALTQRARNRAERRAGSGADRPRKLRLPPTPEHFHIAYHVPAENIVIPYFREVFETQREAYLRVQAMGTEAEPQTEWYENGLVGIETTLHGRSGIWWVVLEVTKCVRPDCRPHLSKQLCRQQLVLLPGSRPVPTSGPGTMTGRP